MECIKRQVKYLMSTSKMTLAIINVHLQFWKCKTFSEHRAYFTNEIVISQRLQEIVISQRLKETYSRLKETYSCLKEIVNSQHPREFVTLRFL